MAIRLTENAIENARMLGDWDWAQVEIDGLLGQSLGMADRVFAISSAIVFNAWRGKTDPELLAEFEAVPRRGPSDPLTPQIDDTLAAVALAEGRFDDARRLWRDVADVSPLNAPAAHGMSSIAAVLAGDAKAARAELAGLQATSAHGALFDARRRAIQAGIDSLEGRVEEGVSGYREALDRLRELGVRLDVALTAIAMATTVGPARPEVKDAVDEAREILESLGAEPFVALLDAAVGDEAPARVRDSTRAATPSRMP